MKRPKAHCFRDEETFIKYVNNLPTEEDKRAFLRDEISLEARDWYELYPDGYVSDGVYVCDCLHSIVDDYEKLFGIAIYSHNPFREGEDIDQKIRFQYELDNPFSKRWGDNTQMTTKRKKKRTTKRSSIPPKHPTI